MKESPIPALTEAAVWVLQAIQQANTNEAIVKLGSRGEILLCAAKDLRRQLILLGIDPDSLLPGTNWVQRG